MGTSVNQRSPSTPNWALAHHAYLDPRIPNERVLRDIWRAALNQQVGDLGQQLSHPAMAQLPDVVAASRSPQEAATAAARFIREKQISSLAGDLARRAAVQSVGLPHAREAFVQRLFAEATNYLVARDLPGHVMADARLSTVGAGSSFKRDLTDLAARVTADVDRRSGKGVSWPDRVGSVLAILRQMSTRR